jgi:hypothetical protein
MNYPAEIGQALLAHPAITDCAVVAAPNALCVSASARAARAGRRARSSRTSCLSGRALADEAAASHRYGGTASRSNGKLFKRRLQAAGRDAAIEQRTDAGMDVR